jgi:hypothetical protein
VRRVAPDAAIQMSDFNVDRHTLRQADGVLWGGGGNLYDVHDISFFDGRRDVDSRT